VRLWTRNGHDWSGRFPLIAEAAQFVVIDGEAVLLGGRHFAFQGPALAKV
jgi:ATP-dependent DNA ligase